MTVAETVTFVADDSLTQCWISIRPIIPGPDTTYSVVVRKMGPVVPAATPPTATFEAKLAGHVDFAKNKIFIGQPIGNNVMPTDPADWKEVDTTAIEKKTGRASLLKSIGIGGALIIAALIGYAVLTHMSDIKKFFSGLAPVENKVDVSSSSPAAPTGSPKALPSATSVNTSPKGKLEATATSENPEVVVSTSNSGGRNSVKVDVHNNNHNTYHYYYGSGSGKSNGSPNMSTQTGVKAEPAAEALNTTFDGPEELVLEEGCLEATTELRVQKNLPAKMNKKFVLPAHRGWHIRTWASNTHGVRLIYLVDGSWKASAEVPEGTYAEAVGIQNTTDQDIKLVFYFSRNGDK